MSLPLSVLGMRQQAAAIGLGYGLGHISRAQLRMLEATYARCAIVPQLSSWLDHGHVQRCTPGPCDSSAVVSRQPITVTILSEQRRSGRRWQAMLQQLATYLATWPLLVSRSQTAPPLHFLLVTLRQEWVWLRETSLPYDTRVSTHMPPLHLPLYSVLALLAINCTVASSLKLVG